MVILKFLESSFSFFFFLSRNVIDSFKVKLFPIVMTTLNWNICIFKSYKGTSEKFIFSIIF